MARRRTIHILGLGDWLEHQTELDPLPPTLDRFAERLKLHERWRLNRVEGELAARASVPYSIEFHRGDLAQRSDVDPLLPDHIPVDDLAWLRELATA